jgi:DNA-directed RNA polymerase subunit RPC12/RpoP
MCKNVKIEYQCDRCGKKTIQEKNPKLGFNIVTGYPKEYKKINKKYLCTNCQTQYNKIWQKFIEGNGGKQ